MLITSLTVTIFYVFYSADLRAGSVFGSLFTAGLLFISRDQSLGLFTPVLLSLPAIVFYSSRSDIESLYSPSIRTEIFRSRIFCLLPSVYL